MMSLQYVYVCTSVNQNAPGNLTCTNQEYVQAYLLPPEYEQTQGGFNSEMFGAGFGAVLLLFATGFGVGLVISQLRKLRIK